MNERNRSKGMRGDENSPRSDTDRRSDPEALQRDFESASAAAVRRLVLRHWLRLLAATGPIVFAVAAAVLIGLRLAGVIWNDLAGAVALAAAWLLATLAWCILRRPGHTEALAAWDEAAGRREILLSAYCFEHDERPTLMQRLHLMRARPILADARPRLRRELPLPRPHRACLTPLLVIVFAATPLLRATPTQPETIDADAQRRAEKLAGDLSDLADQLKKDDAMSKEEKDKLEKLKKKMKETGAQMSELKDKTPREVLEALERRAREAEELAKAMGASDPAKLSSAMLAELARHADTADFANAARADDLGKMAAEAMKIAKKLERADLTLEEAERLKRALKEALKKATDQDRKTLIGRHVAGSHKHLKQGDRPKAAQQWRKLAQQLQRAGQRRQMQQRLAKMAGQMRQAGGRVFAPQGGGVQRLAQMPKGNLQQLGRMGAGQWAKGQGQGQMGQVGRLVFGPQGQGGKWGQGGFGRGMGRGQGQGQGKGWGKGSGGGQGAGQGGAPVPGSGAGRGGHKAGVGTAPLTPNTKTKPHEAGGPDTVSAVPGSEGASQTRTINTPSHKEGAQRSYQQIAIERLRAEEEALAAEPLPLSRRDQVRRYFQALRTQIERADPQR